MESGLIPGGQCLTLARCLLQAKTKHQTPDTPLAPGYSIVDFPLPQKYFLQTPLLLSLII